MKQHIFRLRRPSQRIMLVSCGISFTCTVHGPVSQRNDFITRILSTLLFESRCHHHKRHLPHKRALGLCHHMSIIPSRVLKRVILRVQTGMSMVSLRGVGLYLIHLRWAYQSMSIHQQITTIIALCCLILVSVESNPMYQWRMTACATSRMVKA
ncbi:hypothetical protein EV363DRAFT_1395346 [Boletus edulis]|uniref:Uncharacterized protein n=1 Tax=Boletus edulis BED1 TaxID=1328754 RepID=A0AAD4GJY0_BOLED|nr:hypothetical protein EV363DRAFT_1403483 [Boletus edulis]KAF8136229.1 hypothetical protein EV363DRAFT_1395346 [Boletus edulis]KAF8448091.1 hypothetical protein L210DRAFT_711731 [Boletus edulis BED1]